MIYQVVRSRISVLSWHMPNSYEMEGRGSGGYWGTELVEIPFTESIEFAVHVIINVIKIR